jgi:hypothetical protein
MSKRSQARHKYGALVAIANDVLTTKCARTNDQRAFCCIFGKKTVSNPIAGKKAQT